MKLYCEMIDGYYSKLNCVTIQKIDINLNISGFRKILKKLFPEINDVISFKASFKMLDVFIKYGVYYEKLL